MGAKWAQGVKREGEGEVVVRKFMPHTVSFDIYGTIYRTLWASQLCAQSIKVPIIV